MNALVVYESLWGNTAAIAQAIAEGLGPDAAALTTSEATPLAVASAELVVAGAPLLGFALPTDSIRDSIRSDPQHRQNPADLSHPSMRSWIESLPTLGAAAAAFETRIWWSPGSSAKKIASLLTEKGLRTVAPPQRFIVTDKYGPLKAGELDRAREWGAELATSM